MVRKSERATEAKDAMALALAAQGKNQVQIAEALGYSNNGGVSKALQRALGRRQQTDAETYREMQSVRLDGYRMKLEEVLADEKYKGQWPRIIEVAVKIEEREAKLRGLDIAEPAVTLTQENLTIVVAANVNVDAI